MKTIAQQIADQFNNDGQVWNNGNNDLYDVCEQRMAYKDQNWEREATRYTFNDGSAIIFSGPAWDLAIPNSDDSCFCFAGDVCRCN